MAFMLQNMALGRKTTNATANTTSPIMHFYNSTTDNQAAVSVVGYFNSVADNLIIGDCIYLRPSDGPVFSAVTAVSPNVTILIF